MFKILNKYTIALSFMLALGSSPVMASCDGLTVSGLSDSAIIELKRKCVEVQTQAVSPAVTANQLEEYADLGKKYGVALSEVAKSVGTTVNELAQTPVGIFMLIMVGWKVLGHDLLGIIGGTIWFITMIPLWIYFFHRLVLNDREVIEKFDLNGKIESKVFSPIKYENGPGPAAGFLIVAFLILCAVGLIMIF